MKTNIIRNIVALVAASGLLTACGIYKSYERPEDIQAPDQYRMDNMAEVKADADSLGPAFALASADLGTIQDSNHLGFMPWKEMFPDPKLQYLIQKGLDSNFDLRNAVLQVRQMQALLAKARLSFTPSLNVSGTEGFNGADMTNLTDEVQELSALRSVKTGIKEIVQYDFDMALEKITSSVQSKDLQRLEQWKEENG